MSAASGLLSNYQHVIGSLKLVTGGAGVYDVEVDGEVLYSKHATGRHAKDGEILELFTAAYGEGIRRFGT